MKKQISPPAWAIRFFQWFCNDHLSDAVLGDMLQLYQRRLATGGKRRADFLFLLNILQFLQPFALRKKRASQHLNPIIMYQNYFKIALRSMSSQKMYTSIKVGGFALGLSACIFISLFIRHELSYDKHYKRVNDIYRVYNHLENADDDKWTSTPAPFATLLRSNFPEIELAARLIPYHWHNAGSNLMRKDDQLENTFEERFAYADPELLEILEIPMVYGQRRNALSAPNTIVLSKKKADKYFPGTDPTGKIIVLNDDKARSFVVGGVMEDFPPTSHLQFDFFITLTGKEFWPGEQTNWCCWNYNPYIRVKSGTDPRVLERKFDSIKKVYIDYLVREKNKSVEEFRHHYSIKLQPVEDVHLRSDGISDIIPHGDIRYIWLFGATAIFILTLACINFINLSTAKSASRAKEVGLRKVVGSYRWSLINQFLSESIIYSFVSFVLALFLIWIGSPYFDQLAGKFIEVPWSEWWFFPAIIGSAVFVGIIAGIYPSFYLSAFKPISVLKGRVAMGMKNSGLRSAMVVFQFTTSIVLVIGMFIIYKQMNFILTTKIGFDKDQVLMIHGANTLGHQRHAFKEELKALSFVQNATITEYLPVDGTKRDQNSFWRDGKSQEEESIGAQRWYIDVDYIETMGMKILEGRNFMKDVASDSQMVIINESMVKALGLDHPVGERIMNWETYTVIGVVEDFHWENMKGEIRPLCFVQGDWGNIVSVKIKSGEMKNVVETVTRLWKKFMPHQPIRYTFLDESYARMYDDVRRMANIFTSFAVLAIIVACLGLFALSAFMVEQRNKEISIRRVLGASLQNIFRLLTDHFVKLVLISFVLATPLAWYLMRKWLEDYEYKTDIGWEIFAISGALSVMIALLTVSYQSVRAALANPANNLRSE